MEVWEKKKIKWKIDWKIMIKWRMEFDFRKFRESLALTIMRWMEILWKIDKLVQNCQDFLTHLCLKSNAIYSQFKNVSFSFQQ